MYITILKLILTEKKCYKLKQNWYKQQLKCVGGKKFLLKLYSTQDIEQNLCIIIIMYTQCQFKKNKIIIILKLLGFGWNVMYTYTQKHNKNLKY